MYHRNNSLVTDTQDRLDEESHIDRAFSRCGYPKWSLTKSKQKRTNNNSKEKEEHKGLVVVPYIKGTSEAISRTFHKYSVKTAMKPVTTVKSLLVHPKDKRELEDTSGVIYKIPCASCNASYIGETSRNFGYRLKEHKKDVESVSSKKIYTRAGRTASLSEFNKSAVTDHAVKENHIIDWKNVSILDKESTDWKRKIKEAIWIKAEKNNMNRDEGGIKISSMYNSLFTAPPPSGH